MIHFASAIGFTVVPEVEHDVPDCVAHKDVVKSLALEEKRATNEDLAARISILECITLSRTP